MKICVLADNPYVTDIRIRRAVDAMLEQQHSVDVLAWAKGREIPENEKNELMEKHKNLNIIFLNPNKNRNIFQTIYGLLWGTLMTRSYMSQLMQNNCDIIYANDLSTLEAAGRAAKKLRVPFIYDSHEIYLPVLKDRIKDQDSLINSILVAFQFLRSSIIERRFTKKAFAFITVNPKIEEYFKTKYQLEKTLSILNVPEKKTLMNPSIGLREKLGISPSAKVVSFHSSVLGKKRGALELAESAKLLPDNIHVVIIGEGGVEPEIRALIRSNNTANLHLLPKIPHEQLLSSIKEADLAVIPIYSTNLSHKLSSPNKLFENLLVHVPVLVPDRPYLKQVVEETGMGMVFEGEITPENLAKNIRYFFENVERKMPTNFESAYYWELESKKLIALIQEARAYINAA